MKVLLTGACGYTGSRLYEKLIKAGHEVLPLDTKWFGDHVETKTPHVDVREVRNISEGTDAIIHLAAIANDPSVAYYPRLSWETGVLATMQLCEAARRVGCEKFIYASSVSVYGADRGMVTERDWLHPLSDYNKTKMAAERVLLSYANNINTHIIRPATVCGLSPRMRMDLTVNMLTGQALRNGKMTLHGGDQWRPSIHIEDLTDLYIACLNDEVVPGIYNAGFENHTLRDIAAKVAAFLDAGIEITEQRDARSYKVDSSKLLATGFAPKRTIDDAIKEIVAAYHTGLLDIDNPQWNNLEWMKHLGVKDE